MRALTAIVLTAGLFPLSLLSGAGPQAVGWGARRLLLSRGTTLLVGAPGRCIHLRGKLIVLSAAERKAEEDGHVEQEEEEEGEKGVY